MMVSPVSFRAADASAFKTLIQKQQTYTQQPAASAEIGTEEKKKGGAGKKILGTIAAAAIAVGALVLGHNKGIFKSEKIKNGILKKGLGALDTAGAWLKQKGTWLLSKLPKKAG